MEQLQRAWANQRAPESQASQQLFFNPIVQDEPAIQHRAAAEEQRERERARETESEQRNKRHSKREGKSHISRQSHTHTLKQTHIQMQATFTGMDMSETMLQK